MGHQLGLMSHQSGFLNRKVRLGEPKADFTAFLQKQFRRKLSYDQVGEILDSYSIPSVDCLFSTTLDSSVLSQISPLKSRKYTQERDKELASVQRAMLNITGSLCCLHDALSSGRDVTKEDIKSILEQSLCLLGSANYQFSTLRRKKILVTINNDKISLAEQSLPNAKRMLFGDDFPSIASKQADLSRGLVKNLGVASRPAKRPRPGSARPPNKEKPYACTYSKYSNRTKNGRSFRAPKQEAKRIDAFIDKWREITSDPDVLSIVLGYKIPLRCKPVQFTLPVTSPNQVNAHLIDLEVESLLAKGAIAEILAIREGFFSRLFLVSKKGGTFRPVIDLPFLNKFVENSHFQMESIHCLKSLLQRGDYVTTLDLKDAYLSVPVYKDSQKFLQFL